MKNILEYLSIKDIKKDVKLENDIYVFCHFSNDLIVQGNLRDKLVNNYHDRLLKLVEYNYPSTKIYFYVFSIKELKEFITKNLDDYIINKFNLHNMWVYEIKDLYKANESDIKNYIEKHTEETLNVHNMNIERKKLNL